MSCCPPPICCSPFPSPCCPSPCPPPCNPCGESPPSNCCGPPPATPPIPCTARLIRPYDCCPSNELCCRPKWVGNYKVGFSWVLNYEFPCLPTLSCRHVRQMYRVGSTLDTNLCPSQFSSRRNSCCIAAMPDLDPCDPCPCHG